MKPKTGRRTTRNKNLWKRVNRNKLIMKTINLMVMINKVSSKMKKWASTAEVVKWESCKITSTIKRLVDKN